MADVPSFMVEAEVEQHDIIQTSATLFAAITQTEVPEMSIIVCKTHSAGVYAMAGASFDSDATYLLPHAYPSIYGHSALKHLALPRELSEKEQSSI